MNSNELQMMQTTKAVFDSFDKDGNGSIDKSEIKPLLLKISSQLKLPQPSDNDISEGFKQLDDNNNNKLEFDEFIQFYKQIYEHLIQNE
jgi:Ca2+-binding EF-hand superfamily protein